MSDETLPAPDATTAGAAPPLPPLRLKRHEERRLAAGHLWVFSNEVDTGATPLTAFAPGDLCAVLSDRDRFLGYAYVNPHSLIAARILSRDAGFRPGPSLLVHRLRVALALRERLYEAPCYRLVHGESDLLPGLVVDRYDDVLVVQIATAGMEAQREGIVAALDKVVRPRAIVFKNDGGARELEGLAKYVAAAKGDLPERLVVREAGLEFHVPFEGAQKTGWFYDQAANRRQFLPMLRGAGRVLDVFSYAGGWAVPAARAGAQVTCVDASAAALEAAAANASANGVAVQTLRGDAFTVLEQLHAAREKFDAVIVDPPAFIKRRKDAGKGEAAYRRLNQLAMQLLPRDGLLVSCSCSYHLEPDALLDGLQKAGRHLGRFVQVIASGGQSPDHPVHPAIPESRYLKAFLCRVTED
ncbi:MAG: class I SAM-dependent rRNA methyltransferase [Proteobacteria bacterium]|nr:class I SAM-dependent rRNA methyltransferase [Pseudomonadota bacterium]